MIMIFYKFRLRWVFFTTGTLILVVILLNYQAILKTLSNTSDDSILTQQPCRVPCWYGLVPGTSTRSEVLEVLQNTDFVPKAWIKEDIAGILGWSLTNRHAGSFYINSDDILYAMYIRPNLDFSMQDIIAVYGEPTAITTRVSSFDEMIKDHIMVEFFYPQDGMTVEFSYWEDKDNDHRLYPEMPGELFSLSEPADTLEAYLERRSNIYFGLPLHLSMGWPGYGTVLVSPSERDTITPLLATMTPEA